MFELQGIDSKDQIIMRKSFSKYKDGIIELKRKSIVASSLQIQLVNLKNKKIHSIRFGKIHSKDS